MIKIEAITLEEAYSDAASKLNCSVTELNVEVVQYPSNGILGLFRKKAIIVATLNKQETQKAEKEEILQTVEVEDEPEKTQEPSLQDEKEEEVVQTKEEEQEEIEEPLTKEETIKDSQENELKEEEDVLMPTSFVSVQDDFVDNDEESQEVEIAIDKAVKEIEENLSKIFKDICFGINEIKVSKFDENTVYIELNGEDAALLIGKEGYRYKALSYMLFNWINSKYNLQLRLEIAEFLKNQEEAVNRYLQEVKENIDRDGRAQTKILDGVLVQIALRELRAAYPNKYVAIRTTRDGLKYIIINDYNY